MAPAYEGPKGLGFSKYASPAVKTPPAGASAVLDFVPTLGTAMATREQLAVMAPATESTPPAAELAVEQGAALKKEVEEHTASFSRAMSSAVTNTHQLLSLLREAAPGADAVEDLWQELKMLFEAANEATAALPDFLEKQRDTMSLYHSSMMNETIRETQQELNLQHKKVNTQHNLILEQQDAFQDYRAQIASKLKQLESLQERVSRLTLEKGNFRTEVDKYKELLEEESARKAEDLKAADVLQKELETLVASEYQLQTENDVLRKTIANNLEQLKTTEQRVTDRFSHELKTKAEQLQKETTKNTSLNDLISTLEISESTVKKELDKLKTEHRLLSVKYSNQASEHATLSKKMNDQTEKIAALTADVDRLQKQNDDLRDKSEAVAELAKANKELSSAKEDMAKQLDSLAAQLNAAKDDARAAKVEVQTLKTKLATISATPIAVGDKALQEKVSSLEEEKLSLDARLAEWTELATRSYNQYKDLRLKYSEAEKHAQDAHDKAMLIADLEQQLAAAKRAQSNGVGADDSAYWKKKYEGLLASI